MPKFFGFYTLVSCRLPWLILHHPLLITEDHGGAVNPDGRSVVIGIIYLAPASLGRPSWAECLCSLWENFLMICVLASLKMVRIAHKGFLITVSFHHKVPLSECTRL